jgi:6-pyruvoyltetrahydropterin/6-carboxytetrahydropterin synthase
MINIRVTREFRFEMAHSLWNYDGPCKNIHGHSYKLYVTVAGKPLRDKSDPKNGMVIDFSELKKIIDKYVINYFDHSVVISSKAVKPELKKTAKLFDKFYIVDYQPTCENLLEHIVGIISDKLPDKIKLVAVKLRETDTSYAEWCASDNQ